jgi:hypothetical protein
VKLSTSWERKHELLDKMADVIDATLVADGIIKPHPKFEGSPTSGYRLLEHAYAEIMAMGQQDAAYIRYRIADSASLTCSH